MHEATHNIPPVDPEALLRLHQPLARAHTVRIGVSGFPSGHTRELCAGCAVALEEWAERSDAPYAIEFVWAEDAFDEAKTRRAVERLIDAGCVAVVGHLSSSAALVASEIYHQAGIPFFAPGSTHPRLTANNYWNVLRVCGRDDELAEMLARVVVERGWRRPALAWQDVAYGRTLTGLVKQALLERGRETVAGVPWSEASSAHDAASLLDSDVLLFAGNYETGTHLLEQLRAIGYTGAIVMGDDAFIAELPMLIGGATDNTYVVSTYVNRNHPDYAPFHRRYMARAGLEPGAYSVTSYVATGLLLQAVDVLLRDGPQAGIDKVRALAAAEETLLGKIGFASNGDLSAFPWDVYRIQAGTFISTSSVAEGN